jgi:hypothetical protein
VTFFADESYRLGPYAVKDVDRDWDKRTSHEDQRARLTCLFAGLLLYQPPELR